MRTFVEWLNAKKTISETIQFFPDGGSDPQKGAPRKFVIDDRGDVIIGDPGYDHKQLLAMLPPDVNSSHCVLGDLSRFGITLRDNGAMPNGRAVNSGLKELAKNGFVTSRMAIQLQHGAETEEISGAELLGGKDLRPDTAQPSAFTGMQLKRDRVLDTNPNFVGNHDYVLQQVKKKDDESRRNAYLNRTIDPEKWFYRSPGG